MIAYFLVIKSICIFILKLLEFPKLNVIKKEVFLDYFQDGFITRKL